MTKREQVLAMVSRKQTTKQISEELGMPVATVRYYRESSKTKRGSQIGEHRRKIKRKALAYSGGNCLKCGYNRCNAALEFHHLDPNEKETGLGSGRTWGWLVMKAEVDKTILICSNCHAELHSGLWNPDHRMIENQVAIRMAYNDKPLTDYADEPEPESYRVIDSWPYADRFRIVTRRCGLENPECDPIVVKGDRAIWRDKEYKVVEKLNSDDYDVTNEVIIDVELL